MNIEDLTLKEVFKMCNKCKNCKECIFNSFLGCKMKNEPNKWNENMLKVTLPKTVKEPFC